MMFEINHLNYGKLWYCILLTHRRLSKNYYILLKKILAYTLYAYNVQVIFYSINRKSLANRVYSAT